MLNKLLGFIQQYEMLQPGEQVVCAVSGGADSVALLYAMKLLEEKLQISVSAAHFNHRLRGAESDADEVFVRKLCDRLEISLAVGTGNVTSGKKGLEAAARNARYAFLKTLSGKIATAHTADDNAETVLMHMVRGTGLKGLGGIMPVNGNVIRPMLGVTRQEVIAFLKEHNLRYAEDSSNHTDAFLRNRLRHHILPLLHQENPKLAENISEMALRLRYDEQTLSQLAEAEQTTDINRLRVLPAALRTRVLASLLEQWGVPEPEAEHIALSEKLVFSDKPSARAYFPGGVCVARCYDKLEKCIPTEGISPVKLVYPGEIDLPELNLRVRCVPAQQILNERNSFTVALKGDLILRSRKAGDKMRCAGGTKTVKEIFIDRKIPAAQRCCVPVLCDDAGVVAVYGIGVNADRLAGSLPAVQIIFECLEKSEER